VVGTGYGRYRVTFGNTQVTEISCHARGSVQMFPNTRTVLDMGGQDTKAIRVGADGNVLDFCMNDKCAAGFPAFLGAAAALEIPLNQLGETALRAKKQCASAQPVRSLLSEVLSWVGKGKKIEEILWGVHQSIASRSIGLLRRVGIDDEVTFTGGVAKNVGMIKALEDNLEIKLNVSPESHFMGALGAALFALDHILTSRAPATKRARSGARGLRDSEGAFMTYVAGIDVGSTYTKTVILDETFRVAGRAMTNTGFKLTEAARRTLEMALDSAGLHESDLAYTVATGFGRHQIPFRDANVTDLNASARGAIFLFPNTRTILDVGGQTMKSIRLDENGRVKSFRLNDKCAAGTGAFLEKTARYMGYGTEEIGPLAATSKAAVPISGVCAVFAESEVINHLSQGAAPADIMYGAIVSLVDRSVGLMRRVHMEPEFTLIGGILRFSSMAKVVREQLASEVNVPEGETVQFTTALGAAILGHRRLEKLRATPSLITDN
jgi:predicted CoA-substrate-specific enzyme activase